VLDWKNWLMSSKTLHHMKGKALLVVTYFLFKELKYVLCVHGPSGMSNVQIIS
jgi:hypothetical protein